MQILLSAAPSFTQQALNSQEELLLSSYRRNFARANLSIKLELINDAFKNHGKFMLPLFHDAVKFVSLSYESLGNDPQLMEIGIKAVNELGKTKDKTFTREIHFLFIHITDDRLKIACVSALAELNTYGDKNFISYLNTLYENGLKDIISGKPVSTELLIAYANALGRFADISSFKPLSKTLMYPVNDKLAAAAKNALNNIPSDFVEKIKAENEEEGLLYVYTVFFSAKDNPNMKPGELGKFAEEVINIAAAAKPEEESLAKQLTDEALQVIAKLKWQAASGTVIKHFYKINAEYKRGKVTSAELIKVINCMGQLASAQCAKAIAAFIGSLNSETEATNTYDEHLVLSTISAADALGSKIAFDRLIYMEYLNYSEEVKKAARAAAAGLKW